ncbi:MAG: IS66 family transposase [Planctomycetes bacterium]|nr:IS66 family transposase [Planctomycetota bacterium]
MATGTLTIPNAAVVALCDASLSEEQAEAIYEQGKDAVIFALLELTKQLAEAQGKTDPSITPSTPSSMIPTYKKPPAKRRGKKRPGGKPGHPGSRRETPERIDWEVEHRADRCPDCGGRLKRCHETRTRYIEDIPEVQPEVTEHTIHRDWCPKCKKKVEPPVADALPGCQLGNRVLVLSAWLHYALGNTLSQIVEVFNFHLQLKLTAGGLVDMWYRLQAVLFAWYEQIQQEALDSAVLHADETGWRVDGKTNWLWCFVNPTLTYFMINRSRGSPALDEFFIREFDGTLITDFWGAWAPNEVWSAVVCAARQKCLVHLLRELEQTEKYKSPGKHWPEFAKKLRRLIGDAIRLWYRQDELSPEAYASRKDRLHKRLAEMIDGPWKDNHAKRLTKRLRKYQGDLFTFLDQEGVPFDNNHAERSIRPAVILRKNSYGNRSDHGAVCQAVLMSVFRTLKQRGHDPIRTVVSAVQQFITTKQLPPLPAPKTTSDD